MSLNISKYKTQKTKKKVWVILSLTPGPLALCLSEHCSFEMIPFKVHWFQVPSLGLQDLALPPTSHLVQAVPHNLAPNSTLSCSLAISRCLSQFPSPLGSLLLPPSYTGACPNLCPELHCVHWHQLLSCLEYQF